MCSSIARWRSSWGRAYQGRIFTNGYTTRYGELAERLVALRDLPEEEVGVGPHAGAGVRAQVLEARCEFLDRLGERLLACIPFLDRKPAPLRTHLEERVGDVLAAIAHGAKATGVTEERAEAEAAGAAAAAGEVAAEEEAEAAAFRRPGTASRNLGRAWRAS